nr:unnamed protein product [Digitaria exilis]
MTTADEGNWNVEQPPLIRNPNLHCTLDKQKAGDSATSRGRREHQARTPVQGFHDGNPASTSSPKTPEWSVAGARKNSRGPYSLTPTPTPPQRRRRKPNPTSRGTKSTTPGKDPRIPLTSEAKKAI